MPAERVETPAPRWGGRPILIDTDLSIDDYVGILYLLQHPAVDVRAITVVDGVVYVKPGVENVRRLVSIVGRRDIAIAGGPETPIGGKNEFPASWRWMLAYLIRPFLPWTKAPKSGLSAPELIRQQIRICETPMSIVALGPLTNIALALQAEPELAAKIDTIFISGGAFHVPGTIHDELPSHPNTVSEWNLYTDPAAAGIVLKSGAKIVMFPLDVTHVHGPKPLLFGKEFVRRLRASAKGRASKLLARLVHYWQMTAPQFPATPIWDGAVAAIVADPSIGTKWADVSIHLLTEPERCAGQTLIDENGIAAVRICLEGDQSAFEAAYLALVSGHEDTGHNFQQS